MDDKQIASSPDPPPQSEADSSGRVPVDIRILLGLGVALVALALFTAWVVFAGAPSAPHAPVAATQADSEGVAGAEASRPTDTRSPELTSAPTRLPSDRRFAFLLLGYGGSRHDGAYLSDSMIVGIADPVQKTLALLSLPRDSWVPLQFDGKTPFYSKLNTAFAYAHDPNLYTNRLDRYKGSNGAGNFAKDTVSRALGIPIANYMGIDFAGFRQAIDAVGGIDVDVPSSFGARYPANDDPDIDPSWMIVRFRKGEEHMNGERAIEFARAREVFDNPGESNDFGRSRRQRIIMDAFKTRLMEPTALIHLPQLLNIMRSHVDTDYSVTAVGEFSQLLLDWKNVRIYQAALTSGNYLTDATGPGGAYVLIPSAPDRSWAPIRAFARRLWEDPAAGAAIASTNINIVNSTGEASAASRLSSTLTKLGYRVGTVLTGQKRAGTILTDRTDGSAGPLIAQLEKDLGVSFEEMAEKPAGSTPELVLDLGADDARVANISIPVDDAAPISQVGIRDTSGWTPVFPTATSTVSPTPESDEEGGPNPTSTVPRPALRNTAPPTPVRGKFTPTPPGVKTPVPTPRPTATATPAR